MYKKWKRDAEINMKSDIQKTGYNFTLYFNLNETKYARIRGNV